MTTHMMIASQAINRPVETTNQKIDRWIREAFNANNADMTDVWWEFNASFTARMGDANFELKRIRLSSPLWPRADEQERENTVKHEACHIITRLQYGFRVKSHGREWQIVMRNCGLRATRCHSVDRTGLHRRMTRYPASCTCGAVFAVGPKVYRNIKLYGSNYSCAKCHSRIVVT